MNIYPDKETMKKYREDGRYTIMPVSTKILSDFITPIEALKILKKASKHCYMLESAGADMRWGRYTFLGLDPKLSITCIDGLLHYGNTQERTKDPSGKIREILAGYRSPKLPELPPFTGGLVGYFAFDYLGYSQEKARYDCEDTEGFYDADLMLFDKVIAFDNACQKIVIMVNVKLEEGDAGYDRGVLELKKLVDLLKHGEKTDEKAGRLMGEVTPLFDRERFCQMVEKGKHYIKEGDIFQIVLSNRLEAPFEGSLLNTYRMLRTVNPSPYMFYFSGTDIEVAGASPETLVKLEDGVLTITIDSAWSKNKKWQDCCISEVYFYGVTSTDPTPKSSTDVNIDASVFPDSEFMRYVKEEVDKNQDGVLSKREIERVREIDFYDEYDDGGEEEKPYHEIKSLQGMEIFSNLEKVYPSVNGELSDLDMSKNPKLKDVEFIEAFDLKNAVMRIGQSITLDTVTSVAEYQEGLTEPYFKTKDDDIVSIIPVDGSRRCSVVAKNQVKLQSLLWWEMVKENLWNILLL